MKEIKAIVQPHMVERVMEALHRLPHFAGATVGDCLGQGRGGGAGEAPSTESAFEFARKTKIEVFCDDAHADELVETIRGSAHTGRPGDGIIMVADLSLVLRIRTGERQEGAV